jgi:rRNA-processing protein FCF1
MEILLDTNFILTCVKQKVDFFSIANENIGENIKWLIPFEVLAELKDLATRKDMKGADKDAAKLSLEMVKLISPEIVSVKNKNVDQGIIDYIKGKDIVLATLDKALKNKVKNRVMVIKDVKRVEII